MERVSPKPTRRPANRTTGLARALSKLGYCSRSKATELIRAGRVQVNGSAKRDAETPVRMERDRLAVDGHVVECSAQKFTS